MFAVALLTVFSGGLLVKAEDFRYSGDEGPSHWGDMYQTCSGKYQSPIDIEEHLLTEINFPPLAFKGFKALPTSVTLSNNGHTVMLQVNTSEKAILSGGPLRGQYEFVQLHFHWGMNDSIGSEDTINNHSFPLELHMVFFKTLYGDFQTALNHTDGLAVIAQFYEIYGDDNAVYSELVDALPSVSVPNTNTRLSRNLALDSLLPKNRDLYFTYHGSLTTPPCYEVVTWIDFKMPILLSQKQVSLFRMMQSTEGMLMDNHRPVQPVGTRPIFYNVGSSGCKVTITVYCLVLSLIYSVLTQR